MCHPSYIFQMCHSVFIFLHMEKIIMRYCAIITWSTLSNLLSKDTDSMLVRVRYGYLLWVGSLVYVLPQSKNFCIQHFIIFHHVIMAPNCIMGYDQDIPSPLSFMEFVHGLSIMLTMIAQNFRCNWFQLSLWVLRMYWTQIWSSLYLQMPKHLTVLAYQ